MATLRPVGVLDARTAGLKQRWMKRLMCLTSMARVQDLLPLETHAASARFRDASRHGCRTGRTTGTTTARGSLGERVRL
jgi:hypothetical protein